MIRNIAASAAWSAVSSATNSAWINDDGLLISNKINAAKGDRFFGYFVHSVNRFGGLVGGVVCYKFSV